MREQRPPIPAVQKREQPAPHPAAIVEPTHHRTGGRIDMQPGRRGIGELQTQHRQAALVAAAHRVFGARVVVGVVLGEQGRSRKHGARHGTLAFGDQAIGVDDGQHLRIWQCGQHACASGAIGREVQPFAFEAPPFEFDRHEIRRAQTRECFCGSHSKVGRLDGDALRATHPRRAAA